MTAPTYIINFSDVSVDATNKKRLTIAPGELNTSTTLELPGAGYAPYGEPIIEDLLHIMESFASPTAPRAPTIGQLWFDTGTKHVKVLESITTVGTTVTNNWKSVSINTTVSTTTPSDITMMWYDISDADSYNHTLKLWNAISNSWQPVVPRTIVWSTTAPTSTNSLWFNISNANAALHEMYAYHTPSGSWRPAASHSASLLVGGVPNANLTTSSIGGNAATATNAVHAVNSDNAINSQNSVNATYAVTATRLSTGRTIALSNGATGGAVFDGSANVTINVTGINANVLSFGTVPVDRLGAAGTRAAGYYLAGNNVWTQLPTGVDSYNKPEIDNKLSVYVVRNNIVVAGLGSNNVDYPYFQKQDDNTIVYLQPRLGYTPAAQSNTLAGYGIGDAYTRAEVNSLIPNVPSFQGDLRENGWTRLPNGLIMQWGIWNMNGGPVVQSVPFNIPMSVVFNIQTQNLENATNESTGLTGLARILSYTNSSFNLFQSLSNTYTAFMWTAYGI